MGTNEQFRTINFRNSTDDEDCKDGIDGYIGTMPVAGRRLYSSINDYGDISIRKKLHLYSEYQKIIAGDFKAVLYIYEYNDAYVICKVEDIKHLLVQGIFIEKTTDLAIGLGLISHLTLFKEALCTYEK